MKNVFIKIAAGMAIAALPALAFAQIPGITEGTAPITSLGQARTSLTAIVNWMIVIFWILAVGFLIWAAFSYLTAGGEVEKLGAAKNQLIYALVAAAVALLSTGLREIATGILKGQT